MRCKKGDLALCVRGSKTGLTCEVIGYGGPDGPTGLLMQRVRFPRPVVWPFGNVGDKARGLYPDAWLRPLRDNPGTDETLTWAGKPQETPTEIIRRETERVS